ncbi:hypothetical protein FB45DRAFT_1126924 [Roridomyces roridus]|uniref:NACHT domain-containing protein n=1 Tax=Roridomyces roridus TaxID=1738132 RepID=A0AAD7B3B6_9AGAR|nr:hypothetical protein FB45DRAFT_1126924 [Roridomyces roridus]
MFSNGTQTQIRGGTFYSASGNIHIQHNHHSPITTLPSHATPGRCSIDWNTEERRRLTYGPVSSQSTADYSPPRLRDTSQPHRYLPSSAAPEGVFGHTPSTHNRDTPFNSNYVPPRDGQDQHGGHRTTIHSGGTYINGNVHHHFPGKSGFDTLHEAAQTAALHDDAESRPSCDTKTRRELLDQLELWCLRGRWEENADSEEEDSRMDTDSAAEPNILWLYGPAGAGKTAIMTSLAQRLRDKNRLGGTFFFRRNHHSKGISDARTLFTTLALQLAINVPELKVPISLAVEKDPTIVTRSMELQLRHLVVEPSRDLDDPSWTFLIDGLDECAGEGSQEEVLRLIGEFIPRFHPLRFVIASRPEIQIRTALEQPAWRGAYRAYNLLPATQEVKTYLYSAFARIRQDWSSRYQDVEFPDPWPSVEDIEHLVWKSSGYFIYANTIVKYVGDISSSHWPAELLSIIINDSSSKHAPYSPLDQLYFDILRATPRPRHERLIDILRVVCYFDMTPSQIENILQARKGDVALSLSGFRSLIDWPEHGTEGTVEAHHATFPDFLCDEARSAEFFVGHPGDLQHLACLIIEELGYRYQDKAKNRSDLFGFDHDTMKGLGYLLSKIQVDDDEIGRRLAQINPDFILCLLRWSDKDQGPLMDWVEKHAKGLYNQWQNYKTMAMYPTQTSGSNEPPSSVVVEVMLQIDECPVILRILRCTLLLHDLDIVSTRFLWGLSWEELHTAMVRLLPIINIAKKHKFNWRGLITEVLDRRMQTDTWLGETSWDLAVGCMELRHSIDSGFVPNVWTDDIQDYGRFIRGCPPDLRLLEMLRAFEPPNYGKDTESRHDHECYDILTWLEMFPYPPEDQIRRWTQIFAEECKRLGALGLGPVGDFEERWNRWQRRLDLSKRWKYREARRWWDSERR